MDHYTSYHQHDDAKSLEPMPNTFKQRMQIYLLIGTLMDTLSSSKDPESTMEYWESECPQYNNDNYQIQKWDSVCSNYVVECFEQIAVDKMGFQDVFQKMVLGRILFG